MTSLALCSIELGKAEEEVPEPQAVPAPVATEPEKPQDKVMARLDKAKTSSSSLLVPGSPRTIPQEKPVAPLPVFEKLPSTTQLICRLDRKEFDPEEPESAQWEMMPLGNLLEGDNLEQIGGSLERYIHAVIPRFTVELERDTPFRMKDYKEGWDYTNVRTRSRAGSVVVRMWRNFSLSLLCCAGCLWIWLGS